MVNGEEASSKMEHFACLIDLYLHLMAHDYFNSFFTAINKGGSPAKFGGPVDF